MENNLNVDPHANYERLYSQFEDYLSEKVGNDLTEELLTGLDNLLDEMWKGQRAELFLMCLSAQLDNPDTTLSDAMEKIFKGNHSQITLERPTTYKNPVPQPTSARKWMG